MQNTTNFNLKKPDYIDIIDIQDMNDNMDTVDAELQARVLKTTQIVAGNGLTGGGALDSNKTVTLGTPTTVTNATTNSVTTTGHTHALTLTRADITGLGIPGEDTNTTYTAGAGLTLTGTVFTPTFGTGINQIPHGNDPRFSDSRTPKAHNQDWSTITGQPTIPTNTNQLTNGAGFVTVDTTYTAGTNVAISGTNVISATDTKYTHPTTAGNLHIPTGGAVGQILRNTASGTVTWQNMPTTDISGKVDKTTQVIAGNGLTGGGALDDNKTLTLGTPTTVTNATTNSVTTTGHTHALTLTKADITGLGIPGEDTNTTYTAGTGLTLTGTVFTPTFGTTVGTVTQGNDSRLSNARTPLAHVHTMAQVTGLGNIAGVNTNASTANYLRGDGAWVTPPDTNTTYTEITTAEIDTGTASTLRTITARRMKYLSDKQMPKSGGILENYSEKLVKMTPGYGEVSLDLGEGNIFEVTASVNLTFFLSGSINNVAQSFTLIVKQPAAPKSLSFYSTIKWQGGEIPDMSTASKTYILTFMTIDGGTTWLGMFGGEF